MKLFGFIKEEFNKLFEDYKGEHTAPNKQSGSPLHDLGDQYGEDIYGSNAVRYFGTGNSYDQNTINIIKIYRNKPNSLIKIYRSVPNLNKEVNFKIKTLKEILSYYNKFEFFPQKNKSPKLYAIVEKYFQPYLNDEGYYKEELNYNEIQLKVYNTIFSDTVELTKEIKPLKINEGDWVSVSLAYVKDHGESNLSKGYKIVQKTVRAREIYNIGDIHEWGFDPT